VAPFARPSPDGYAWEEVKQMLIKNERAIPSVMIKKTA
jgi:hypothetical protein